MTTWNSIGYVNQDSLTIKGGTMVQIASWDGDTPATALVKCPMPSCEYRYPKDLEDAARKTHGEAHSAEEVDAVTATWRKERADAERKWMDADTTKAEKIEALETWFTPGT